MSIINNKTLAKSLSVQLTEAQSVEFDKLSAEVFGREVPDAVTSTLLLLAYAHSFELKAVKLELAGVLANAHSLLKASTFATDTVTSAVQHLSQDMATTKSSVESGLAYIRDMSRNITSKLIAANFTTITQPAFQVAIAAAILVLGAVIGRGMFAAPSIAALTEEQHNAVNSQTIVLACVNAGMSFVYSPVKTGGASGICVQKSLKGN